MIRYSKYHACCLFLVLLMTLLQPFAVFADVMTSSNAFADNPDYLLSSSSDALLSTPMTLELGEDDFALFSPRSSLGTVTNTIDLTGARFYVYYYDASAGVSNVLKYGNASVANGRLHYSIVLDSGDQIVAYGFEIPGSSLPSPGDYWFAFDIASDFSLNYRNFTLNFRHNNKNAGAQDGSVEVYPATSSGDALLSSFGIRLTTLEKMKLQANITSPLGNAVGGDIAFRFLVADNLGDDAYTTPGTNSSTEDYQSGVSGSLSDISSSIGDMSESLDSAAENLEYISTSQNLIIQGIDNVIMHISDQLYAFWDQLYNLIHEPTYARLGDILDAIRNLDLEITVEMTEVTNAVNKMNQEVQNKLQQTTDKITGGFDNSVMESEANKLDTSISEYDEAEQSVIQNVNDSLDNFEFDAELGEYQFIVSVISDFLQELYDSSGGFKVLINLSMLLSLAGIVIGIYRFGGGS